MARADGICCTLAAAALGVFLAAAAPPGSAATALPAAADAAARCAELADYNRLTGIARRTFLADCRASSNAQPAATGGTRYIPAPIDDPLRLGAGRLPPAKIEARPAD